MKIINKDALSKGWKLVKDNEWPRNKVFTVMSSTGIKNKAYYNPLFNPYGFILEGNADLSQHWKYWK